MGDGRVRRFVERVPDLGALILQTQWGRVPRISPQKEQGVVGVASLQDARPVAGAPC